MRSIFRSVLAILALVVAGPLPLQGQERTDREVVFVIPDKGDARFDAAREAITFWNQTLAELKLRTRLLEASVLVAPPISRALENYTRQVWLLAGRPVPKGDGPQPPRALVELPGDIVVFLSNQQFFSFAWPFAGKTRYFIGVQTDRTEPMTYANIPRNVIAHEFGHALGLEHNGNTPTLMCGPCEHLLYWSEQPLFFPLTSRERGRLQKLHQAE
jgi:hypothetical protein